MSDIPNEDGEVNWNAVVGLLREGRTAEIPCADERDYVRRATQVAKRAERKGIAIEVIRGEGLLRVEPRPVTGDSVTTHVAGEGTESLEERQELQERRNARRAERQAGRIRDD